MTDEIPTSGSIRPCRFVKIESAESGKWRRHGWMMFAAGWLGGALMVFGLMGGWK